MAAKSKKSAQPKKNPAAQALSKLRWARTTAEERSRYAQRISKIGWTGANAKRRKKAGGRPPDPDRCPCGLMTAARAAKRKHRCTAQR